MWATAGLLFIIAGAAIMQWLRAERDERRWRRKFKEQQDRALIREVRYGASKRDTNL